MANRSSDRRFSRYACSTSWTPPQICGITVMPARSSASRSPLDIPPQSKVLTPHSTNWFARVVGVCARSCSCRQTSGRPDTTCATRSRPATSNTGETRPSQSGMATIFGRVSGEDVNFKEALSARPGSVGCRGHEPLRAIMVPRSVYLMQSVRFRDRAEVLAGNSALVSGRSEDVEGKVDWANQI